MAGPPGTTGPRVLLARKEIADPTAWVWKVHLVHRALLVLLVHQVLAFQEDPENEVRLVNKVRQEVEELPDHRDPQEHVRAAHRIRTSRRRVTKKALKLVE